MRHRAIGLIKTILRPGVVLALWRNRQTEFRYQLAIAAIFRDEARFLDEWLCFHRGVGVEHFYLYNNKSTDNYLEVLSPWIAAGIVTFIDWPHDKGQPACYDHCVRHYRKSARWVAFIDIDEFLFSPKGRDLKAFLGAYGDLSAIFVYWLLFGSSGHVKRPPGPVVKAYTRRLNERTANEETVEASVTGRGKQGKCIVNPRLVRRAGVHSSKMWIGDPLDERRRPRPHVLPSAVITCQVFRINHYWSRSIQDLNEKMQRGKADKNEPRDLAKMLQRERELNAVEDRTILPLWDEIKAEPRP